MFVAPDIADIDLTGEAAVTQWIHPGNMAGQYPTATTPGDKFSADGAPEWGVDPANGMHFMRMGSLFDPNPNAFTNGALSRLISWFLKFGYPGPLKGYTEVYFRYVIMIEGGVAAGFNELGMKLPGLGSQATQETISLRMEHTPPAAGMGLVTYWYDAESGNGFGEILKTSADHLLFNRWLCIEQRVKLNTIVASPYASLVDGEGDVWLDDQLVWTSRAKRWRWFANDLLDVAHINVFHGGGKNPTAKLNYRIARIAASTQRIGRPPELLAAPPVIVTPTPPSLPPDLSHMTPQNVVDLCAAAYNGACSLAGVPDLPAQLAAAGANSAAVAQANTDRDAALAARDAALAARDAAVTAKAASDAALASRLSKDAAEDAAIDAAQAAAK